ncbi:MAG: lycopene cyclase [Flavobacteriaceae bacterium]|nr:lycopene cyclase [Flavobacteriaceae bacterium]
MVTDHYDYIIIGSGLAGLQLALAFSKDSYFNKKKIALIDPSPKTSNDKTWSFWETEPGNWNNLVYKTWKQASVISKKKHIQLALEPYNYKSIRSVDFYRELKTQLKKHHNISFLLQHVTSVKDNDKIEIHTNTNSYTANHVFDSRIPDEFSTKSSQYTTLIQHFKGWVIQTDTNAFNEEEVTMMDYRLKDGEQTTFMYVLPFSKKKALVEFTYFTEKIVDDATYESFIKQYINNYLNIKNYEIIETETGQIPMTNFPFDDYNTNYITKIGTAGGWVKGSSGYSFKHTEKRVNKIIDNIKSNKTPSSDLFKRKYKFYDKVFLKVLKDDNHKGEWIFQEFYSKNSIQTMFRFLDEDSTFFEEVKVMLSLFSWSFIKAFIKTL